MSKITYTHYKNLQIKHDFQIQINMLSYVFYHYLKQFGKGCVINVPCQRILIVSIKSSFSVYCTVVTNRFTMNSQFCTCKSCHIPLSDSLEWGMHGCWGTKGSGKAVSCISSNNCCVLQTNCQAINKNLKFALKLGVIPKMNSSLLEVKCRQECKKGKKPQWRVKKIQLVVGKMCLWLTDMFTPSFGACL